MPQQAVTNGYWKSEYLRAQPRILSNRVVMAVPWRAAMGSVKRLSVIAFAKSNTSEQKTRNPKSESKQKSHPPLAPPPAGGNEDHFQSRTRFLTA